MNQIISTFEKIVKELLRNRSVLFWTIAWPIIWVLIDSFAFAGNAPKEIISSIRGSITISMTVFALTIAGMANLPGIIARDRERGLLTKLKSMPVSPFKDFTGRIIGLIAFSSLAAILVAIVGFVCGAHFSGNIISIFQSIAFLLIVFLSSAGIGLIIGTFIRHVQGAVMTGVGVSVVTASISGLFAPYSSLPSLLQKFSQIYPVSSANSSIVYLLVGERYAGYNPLSINQIIVTATLSFLLFFLGLVCYSKFCWGKR